MLELHVADTDVTTGSISVGWCVSQDTLQELARNKIKDPVVVLITSPEGDYAGKKEWRTVVSLKDLVGYVEFRAAGKMNIWGFITENKKVAKDNFLDVMRTSGNYFYSVLNHEATDWYRHSDFASTVCPSMGQLAAKEEELLARRSKPVSVMVPEDIFAPEPAEWEKAWVNHFLGRNRPVDQCDFRRRRLFAYTVQPVLMLLGILFRAVLTLFSLLLGLRGFTMEHVLHPMSHSIFEAEDLVHGGTWFVGRGNNEFLNWIRLPLIPVAFPFYVLLYCTHAFVPMLLVLGALASLGGFFLLISYFGEKFIRYSANKEKNNTGPAWYLDTKEMSYLVCNGEANKATSLKDLPFAKRTVRLQFQNIKSKICRPFSA